MLPELVIIWLNPLPQQSAKEDVFPDAEGWENVDPDEAAKWATGSEFPSEQSQTEAGAAGT